MIRSVAVYCSSSTVLNEAFVSDAEIAGKLLAENGFQLVWGGVDLGLMGRVAHSTQQHGGRVVGIIPQTLVEKNIAYQRADDLIIAPDLQERKKLMEEKADAFLVLAGGFGTAEEVLEILTLKQLQLHAKPVVFVNTRNFYDHLLSFFENMYAEKISKPEFRALYHVADNVPGAFSYLKTYQPPVLPNKWF